MSEPAPQTPRPPGWWRGLPSPARKVIAGVVGIALLATGAVLMVLPGPGIPIMLAGLVVMASEYTWARTAQHRLVDVSGQLWTRFKGLLSRALIVVVLTAVVWTGLIVLAGDAA